MPEPREGVEDLRALLSTPALSSCRPSSVPGEHHHDLLEDHMQFDPTTLALVLITALLCATVVCVVALCRAHRTDTVALVRALAELVSVFTRYRQKKR